MGSSFETFRTSFSSPQQVPNTAHHKFIRLFIFAPIKEQAFELSDVLAACGTNTHFVIVRDQNSEDCVKLKQRLKNLCQQAGQPDALV
jgi:enterochelin esterase-like enzyme